MEEIRMLSLRQAMGIVRRDTRTLLERPYTLHQTFEDFSFNAPKKYNSQIKYLEKRLEKTQTLYGTCCVKGSKKRHYMFLIPDYEDGKPNMGYKLVIGTLSKHGLAVDDVRVRVSWHAHARILERRKLDKLADAAKEILSIAMDLRSISITLPNVDDSTYMQTDNGMCIVAHHESHTMAVVTWVSERQQFRRQKNINSTPMEMLLNGAKSRGYETLEEFFKGEHNFDTDSLMRQYRAQGCEITDKDAFLKQLAHTIETGEDLELFVKSKRSKKSKVMDEAV